MTSAEKGDAEFQPESLGSNVTLSCEDCEVSVTSGKLNKYGAASNLGTVCSSEEG